MKFSKITSGQPEYLRGALISIEIDISRGLHSFTIVGMPNRSVEESRDRVSSALKNSKFSSPKTKNEKCVVSLTPADLKKEGSYHDLAIALGYLLASGDISFDTQKKLFIGELSLDGKLQSVVGILPIIQIAKEAGYTEVYLPKGNAEEAALITGINIYPVDTLISVINHLDTKQDHPIKILPQEPTMKTKPELRSITDFKDIRGQELAKRGLEIAAAGGHNVCMFGPPGTGKTMLARAFSSILPPLNSEQALEVTGIHSVAGNLQSLKLIYQAPFRAPHHTSSYVALVGGGTNPRPGEVTLAHHGVLFLDEFPEFDKKVIESLRQPLEDGEITVSRAKGTVRFPANIILVAAMNPCPCGFFGSEHGTCTCTASDILRYQKKISGPIMDRIDMWIPVEHIAYEKLSNVNDGDGENSKEMQERVLQSRMIQYKRNKGILNKNLSSKNIQTENIPKQSLAILNSGAEKLKLSPRAYHRVIKLARTIADLEKSLAIQPEHILEALQYRPQIK